MRVTVDGYAGLMATDGDLTAGARADSAGALATRKAPRGLLARLRASQSELDASELTGSAIDSGAHLIDQCSCGVPATVFGRLRSVTLSPNVATPTLEAELYDGSGSLTLVFLGRRRIPGITPGRSVAAHGRPIVRGGTRTMINPRYELLPVGSE